MGQTAVLADEVVEVPETEEQSEVIAEDTRETEEVQMSAGAAEEAPRLKSADTINLGGSYKIIDSTSMHDSYYGTVYDNVYAGFCYDNDTKTLILNNVNLVTPDYYQITDLGSDDLTIFFMGDSKLTTAGGSDGETLLKMGGTTGGKIKLIGADKNAKLTLNSGDEVIALGDKVKLDYYSGQVAVGKFVRATGEKNAELDINSEAVDCEVKVKKSTDAALIPYTGTSIESKTYSGTGADIDGVTISTTAEQPDTGYKVELTETGSIKINIDSSQKINAVVKDKDGNKALDQSVIYMSSDPAVVRVDPHTGEITGAAKGKATITVRARADLRKSASIDVNVGKYYDFTFRSGIDGVPDKVIQVEDGQKFKLPDDKDVVSWNEAYKTKTDEYKLFKWEISGCYDSSKWPLPGDEVSVTEDVTFKAVWRKYVTVTFKKDIRNTKSDVITVSASDKAFYKGQRFDLMKIEEKFPEILTDDSEPYHKFYVNKFIGWYDTLTKHVYDPSRDGYERAYHYDEKYNIVKESTKVPRDEGEDIEVELWFRGYGIDESDANDTINFFGVWDIPADDPIYSDPTDPTPTPDPTPDPTPTPDPSDPTPTPSPTDPTNPTTPSGNNSTTPSANTHVRAENTCVKGEKVNLASMVFSGVTGISKYKIDSGGSGKGSVNGKGIFKGKKPGTVIVIAQDSSGKELAAVVMTVLNKPKLKFRGKYAIGQTFDAYDCFTTDDTKTTAADEWASSKTSVATVDQKTGMITIVGKGKTKITAKFGNVVVKAKLKIK